MSLEDLIARCTPDRPLVERRALLDAMATCLPAPEFLWYDLAMQALHGEEDELKVPAIALLAHAPRSWHQVLMTALTLGEPAIQVASVRALHAHAQADAERRSAFEALAELPGWSDEARALIGALSKVPEGVAEGEPAATPWPARPEGIMDFVRPQPAAPDGTAAELAAARQDIEVLESRVLELEDENFLLREDRMRLGAAYESERRRAQSLEVELVDLRDRHERLHLELLDQIEQLRVTGERQARQHELAMAGMHGALDVAHSRQRRTMFASFFAMVVLAGPLAYGLVARSTVMAASPEDRLPKVAPVLAPQLPTFSNHTHKPIRNIFTPPPHAKLRVEAKDGAVSWVRVDGLKEAHNPPPMAVPHQHAAPAHAAAAKGEAHAGPAHAAVTHAAPAKGAAHPAASHAAASHPAPAHATRSLDTTIPRDVRAKF